MNFIPANQTYLKQLMMKFKISFDKVWPESEQELLNKYGIQPLEYKEIKMPRIDNIYECANYNKDAKNLNQTCRLSKCKRCILLEDNYMCYDFKKKKEESDAAK